MKKKILSALLILSVILSTIVVPIHAETYTTGLYTYTVTDGKATITDVDTSIFGLKGKVTVPSTLGGYPVVAIGKEAYKSCEKMVTVIIPEGITSIGVSAFSGCTAMTSITIPEGVTTIGSHAFFVCTGLTSITIPKTVTSIGEDAFEDCGGITSVNISSMEAWLNISFGDVQANPLFYAKNLYLNGELVTELVIPEGSKIKKYAFCFCHSLTKVTIPEGVTSIGNSAFSCCENITEVTIPKSVTSIGDSAFNCKSLQTVNYAGTEEDWCIISIGDGNDKINEADIVLNYNADIAKAEIKDVEVSDSSIKFISEVTTSGEPSIATFGTTFIPLWLFETGSGDVATVEYDNSTCNIKNADTFGATLQNIPESCKGMLIVGKSYIKDADGNYTWSKAKSASVNNPTLNTLE